MGWDGHDRRRDVRADCCVDMQSRVSTLEALQKTQERDLDRLLRAHEQTNTRLETTNISLNRAINKLTEIKTTQRNTHVFAGLIGTMVGGVVEYMGRKITGG
ncbi:MAG: hypothetical protein KGI37_07815 [Alphaproteobacteria bacterium]|nr:hypothetical protein [Alphaproteobacteria bacterium]